VSDDAITKPERIPLGALVAEQHKRSLIEKHDALVLNELRSMLKRQQEQELVVEELRGIIDTLSAGMVATIDEVQTLQRNVDTLTRHLRDLHDRQDKIAELCDHLTASIAGITEP
jgi:broad-specificity NMP kinase